MIPYDYVLFGQIQSIKAAYYEEHGSGLSFQGAVQALAERQDDRHGIPEKPDFLSWNLTNDRELQRLVEQIPIALSEIRNIRNMVQNDIRRLSVYNHVQISIEACYSDMQMISVGYFSVCYVLKGSGRLKLAREERMMLPGELCIIPPYVPYAIFTAPEDLVINIVSAKEHFKENFSQLLYRDNIVSAFFRRALLQEAMEPVYFVLQPTKDIRSLIQHLFAEFVTADSYSETLFNNYLQIFYANIIRCSENQYDESAPRKQVTKHTLMPAILSYINQNYRTISLGALAAHFHYDSAYLSRRIRRATGKKFSEIVADLKIKEARELLTLTDRSIGEIAEITGYASADHFGYTFRKVTGMSPREYRKTHTVRK